MGGAYAAISDDVSGTYYNPWNCICAKFYYSINASSYNQIKVNHKTYLDPVKITEGIREITFLILLVLLKRRKMDLRFLCIKPYQSIL